MFGPSPVTKRLTPCAHGGIDYAELRNSGYTPQTVLDFSVSCNPFGPPPGIRQALATASIERYPDSRASELRQLLARRLGISTGNLIIGSGSTELVRMLATAYFDRHDLVLIPQPTYGEYEIACQLAAAQVLRLPILKDPDFRLNAPQMIDLIQTNNPKGMFLCNPNNPTGQYLLKSQVEMIMSSAPESLLILDEAYIAFTENAWTSVDLISRGNLVILRSMTKDYALAGLRLGYAIAAERIVSVLERVRPPWNVNSMAQAAGVFALSAKDYLKKCEQKINEAKKFLTRQLEQLGLPTIPSKTNFFLVKVGNATQFRQEMLAQGILVRDCTSFGLPQYIRLAPRTLPECERLINAIKETGVLNRAS